MLLGEQFRKSAEVVLTEEIGEEMQKSDSRLICLIKIKNRLISSMLLVDRHETGVVSITTQLLIETMSKSCMKALIAVKNANISREIAVALFGLESVDEELIQSILNFNVDKEKLELEIRMQLLALIVDGKTD